MNLEQARKFNEFAKEMGIIDGDASDGKNHERPLIKIPSDQRELIDFCNECGIELGKYGRLCRRDRTVVAINKEKARLDVVTPRALCSLAQQFIRFS